MENRATDRLKEIQRRLLKYFGNGATKNIIVTNRRGFGVEKSTKFYDGALKASESKKYYKDKAGIYWLPLIIEDQTIAVCGLKDKIRYPKEEAALLTGLLDEIIFDEFLERQTNRAIDHKCNYIKELLTTDHFKTFEEAIDRGDILGLNLRAPQAVILIKVPGYTKKAHSKLKNVAETDKEIRVSEECNKLTEELSAAFKNYEQNIFSCISPDLFICLKWVRGQVNTLNTVNFFRKKAEYIQEVVEKKTKIKPTIGVGQYYPGLSGLKKSYSDASVALNLGEKIWGPEKIYHILDVGMYVSLTPEISFERKCELAYQIMGKVFNDRDLYKTVNVFLDNDMNLSVAASKLHIHRNTLIYRLNKIKNTINRDPRKFSDAVRLKLGLILFDPNKKQ